MEENILKCIHKVFDTEITELIKTKKSISENVVEIVKIIDRCNGKVIITGMGKPGHIARKIAATMSSLGINSYFLHPAEASHGDLGTLSPEDIIIMISNSGETVEICNLLSSIKRIGATIIAITSYEKSTLAQVADYVWQLPVIKEACSLELAPTSSSTVELVAGDALAVAVSEMRGFKKEDFALYHPSGTLGKRLLTKVSDLMRKGRSNPIVVSGSSLKYAINVMSKTGMGAVTIVDKKCCLCGIITDGDLKRLLDNEINVYEETVDNVMTENPIYTYPDLLVVDVLKIIENNKKEIKVLPVVNRDMEVLGLLRYFDIMRSGIV